MQSSKTESLTIEKLNELYKEADDTWAELFAEMRTNIMLSAGHHYSKKKSEFWTRIRSSAQLTSEQKIRLTKNHIGRLIKHHVNHVITSAAGEQVFPKNEGEIQDTKAAQLNASVLEDIKSRHKLKTLKRKTAKDFFEIGEIAAKVFWDDCKGKMLGYEEEVQTQADGTETILNRKPVMSGDLVVEKIFGFDLLVDPTAKSFEDARYVIYRKLKSLKDLKASVPPDQQKNLEEAREDTFKVFDALRGDYAVNKDKVLVREFYWRPCLEYPNGYFSISTEKIILAEGELPNGIFPIVFKECEEISTLPRGRSPIKNWRPFQAEINRSASEAVDTLLKLGSDKLILTAGSKISHGGTLHGVRAIQVGGPPPTVMPGRDASNHLNYMSSQIAELYQFADLSELNEEKELSGDAYQNLYSSMKKRKKFAIYVEKFSEFWVELCEKILETARFYYDERHIIPAIGNTEIVNIAEFKNTKPLNYQIKIEAADDDIDTAYGKQLIYNNILQYVGPNLKPEDLGKVLRSMPFLNNEALIDDMTLDFDNATNDILKLDRGEWAPPRENDDHDYMIKRLNNRMRKSDFSYLHPDIQEMYSVKKQMHMSAKVEEAKQLKAIESDFIPTSGFLVACDFYVQADPNDPSKTKRVRLPSDAVDWLVKRLDDQGATLDKLQSMDMGTQAQLAQMYQAANQGPQQPSQDPSANPSPQPGAQNSMEAQ